MFLVSMMDISTAFREQQAFISSLSEGLFLHYPFFLGKTMWFWSMLKVGA